MDPAKTPKHRFYKTIGIDHVFLEPPEPGMFPQAYLQKNETLEPFVSPEIVGELKSSASDFIVREIAKRGREIPGTLTETERQAFQVADLIDLPPPQDFKKKENNVQSEDQVNDTTAMPLNPPRQKEGSSKGGQQRKEAASKEIDNMLEKAPLEYLKKILKGADETEGMVNEVVESLQSLQARALERIDNFPHKSDVETISIPPVPSFHKALRFTFPLLQSKPGPHNKIEVSTDDFFDGLIPFLYKPAEDLPLLYRFQKRGCLASTIKHPQRQTRQAPRIKGDKWGKRKREETRTEADVVGLSESVSGEPVLRLKPDLGKDVRRSIHKMLAGKNKAFQTQTLSSHPLDDDSTQKDATTTAILIFWHSGAQHRARKKFKQTALKLETSKEGKAAHLPHTLCVLKKQEKEHLAAITALCAAVRCRTADVGLAGIKDMKAVTFQYCTFRNTNPARVLKAIPDLKGRGIGIGTIRKVGFFLLSGDLEGNRFEITLRNIHRVHVESSAGSGQAKEVFHPCEKLHLKEAFERTKRSGFVNFYGDQRVGAPGDEADVGVRSFDIGKAMLQGDFYKAIDLIMIGRSLSCGHDAKVNPKETKVRRAWKESGGNPGATLKEFPRGESMPKERALMKGLKRYGKSEPLAAIKCLPHNVRKFWINAYQSFVWNSMASARLKRYGCCAVIGDLFVDDDTHGKLDVKVVNTENLSTVTLEQVVLPLPGFAVQYPENDIGPLYAKLLREDGIQFEKKVDEERTAKGAYRRLITKAKNMGLSLNEEVESCSSTMTIRFDLSSGSYATMLLRELMYTTVARS